VLRRLMFQDALGEHQDAVTQIAWLRAYAARAAPLMTPLAMGAVVGRAASRSCARVARA
jgi:alpha/beta superfamily hydrolase